MYHGERFNAWTHLVGTLLSFFGVGALVAMAAATGDPWRIVSVAVFGSTLILLYGASTLYHSLRGRAKLILRKLDHLSIYLLIAGTYTPFCLITLRGAWGWSLFAAIWSLALMLEHLGEDAVAARILAAVETTTARGIGTRPGQDRTDTIAAAVLAALED